MSACLRQFLVTLAAALAAGAAAVAQAPPPVGVRPQAELLPQVVDMTPPELAARPATVIDTRPCPPDSPPAFLVSAEYLLVRPRRRANDFAITDPFDNLTPEGRIDSVNYDLTSGVRAGVGYRWGGTPWETLFTYTYLHAGGDRATAAPPGGLVYPTLTRPGLVDNALSAAAGAGLTYNLYDLETARRFAVDETFAFRLGFGVRFASIDQSLQAFYFGGDAAGTQVHSRVEFNGAGPMVGGEGEWLLPRGFRLFGRARGSLVVGDVSNCLRETDNAGRTVNAAVGEGYTQVVPVLELATGVAWQYRNVRLAAGYEVANWFNLIDSPTFVNDFAEGKLGRRRGDLSLEGLFLQLGLVY